MNFDIFSFLIGRAIATQRGLDSQAASKIGFLSTIIKPRTMGIVVAAAMARREADELPQAVK